MELYPYTIYVICFNMLIYLSYIVLYIYSIINIKFLLISDSLIESWFFDYQVIH